MQRTNIIELKPNKLQRKILKEMLVLSSSVYNQANYDTRQKIFKQEKILGFRELQQKIQKNPDYLLLGRSYALPRIQQYSETISAWFKLIQSKTQECVGLPKYYKNRKTNTTLPSYLVMDNCQYSINQNTDKVTIPLSRLMRKKYKLKSFRLDYNGVLKWLGVQQRGQIHHKNNKWYLYQSVEVKQHEPKPIANEKVYASVDLGIKRFMSSIAANGKECVIGSNRFYKQWLYLSKVIFLEQSKLNLRGRKMSRKLSKLFANRTKYIDNLFNNLVAKLFRFLARNKVNVLVVGDLKGILEDNDKGSRLNKMTHNYWSFCQLLRKLANKCEEYGVELRMETEEYTSMSCPVCGDASSKNKKDRLFVCSLCGYFDDRDIIGAKNIMVKHLVSMYGSVNQSIHWDEITPLEEAW